MNFLLWWQWIWLPSDVQYMSDHWIAKHSKRSRKPIPTNLWGRMKRLVTVHHGQLGLMTMRYGD